jgi:hypothetical protein
MLVADGFGFGLAGNLFAEGLFGVYPPLAIDAPLRYRLTFLPYDYNRQRSYSPLRSRKPNTQSSPYKLSTVK